MKLITLNVWGGKIHAPLLDFISRHAKDTDIFCFQEVFSSKTVQGFSGDAKMDVLEDIAKILSDHQIFHAHKSRGYDYSGYMDLDVTFGNTMFIKNNLQVQRSETLFDAVEHPHHKWHEFAIGKAQYIQLLQNGTSFTICNFHGVFIQGSHKLDTDLRIEQSQQVKALLDSFSGEKILCGDFNIVPDGKSMAILEAGMENLIKTHHITSTRSSFYKKDIGFADYILTTPGITVKHFSVLQDQISDHLPLLLEFDI